MQQLLEEYGFERFAKGGFNARRGVIWGQNVAGSLAHSAGVTRGPTNLFRNRAGRRLYVRRTAPCDLF